MTAAPGPGAHAVVAGGLDVRDRPSWDALVDRGVSAFGRLGILVNNAGVLRTVAHEHGAPETFEDLWRVNCLGAFHGMQALVPHLRRAGGCTTTSSGVTGCRWHG